MEQADIGGWVRGRLLGERWWVTLAGAAVVALGIGGFVSLAYMLAPIGTNELLIVGTAGVAAGLVGGFAAGLARAPARAAAVTAARSALVGTVGCALLTVGGMAALTVGAGAAFAPQTVLVFGASVLVVGPFALAGGLAGGRASATARAAGTRLSGVSVPHRVSRAGETVLGDEPWTTVAGAAATDVALVSFTMIGFAIKGEFTDDAFVVFVVGLSSGFAGGVVAGALYGRNWLASAITGLRAVALGVSALGVVGGIVAFAVWNIQTGDYYFFYSTAIVLGGVIVSPIVGLAGAIGASVGAPIRRIIVPAEHNPALHRRSNDRR